MNTKDYGKRVHTSNLFTKIIAIIIVILMLPFGISRVDAKTKVTIQSSMKYIEVGSTFTMKAVSEPNNVTLKSMTWKVKSGKAIKKVSGNKFKAVSTGKATIEGHQKDTNKKYKATFEVNKKLPSFDVMNLNRDKVSTITLYPSSNQVIYGKFTNEKNLGENAYEFSYKVKDKKIAMVNSFGVLTGKKVGSTTLVVTAPNGAKKEYKVKVKKAPKTLWKDSLYLTDMKDNVSFGGYFYQGYYGDNNYSSVDKTYLFTTTDGNLILYNYLDKECALSFEVYDKDYKRIEYKKVKLPYAMGGVYLGEDGNTYVVCGQTNIEESNTKTVYTIIKYDKNMEEVDRCNISGRECSTTVPFDAGSCSMTMQGDTLVVHTARERYTADDGYNHQSNITFVINTDIMTKRYVGPLFPYNHVSHSFNQFVRFDGNDLIYVDHGDAYPRSVVMQIHRNGALDMADMLGGTYWRVEEIDLINILGQIGNNHTGTRVGGFEIGKYNNIVAGISLPHDTMTEKEFYNFNTKNVYVALVSKKDNSSKLVWLTDYKEGSNKTAMNLRMVKINEDRFGLIYQIDDFNDINGSKPATNIGFILIDSKGNVLTKQEWDGEFRGHMQPVVYQGDIIWLVGSLHDRYFLNEEYDYNIVERIHIEDIVE